MAASTQPILYLPLDTNTSLPLTGTAHGTTIIPDDPTFGKCLSFNGTSDNIEFPDQQALRISEYTAEVWIKPEGVGGPDYTGILGKPGRNYHIWLYKTKYIHHRFHITTGETDKGAPDTPPNSIAWKEWNHVAITNDGTTAKTYINGVEKASGPTGGDLIVDLEALYLGRNPDGGSGYSFNGRMAHVRLYDRALSRDEILADIAADLGLQTDDQPLRFGASYPLAFRLRDANQESVLYTLPADQPQTLTLEITNTARGEITPTKPDTSHQQAAADNHHFALCFRPGTLDTTLMEAKSHNAGAYGITLKTVTQGTTTLPATDWSLAAATVQDGADCLYLLWKNPKPILPLQHLILTLQKIYIDGSSGTRSTNVMLRYDQLKIAGQPLSGRREYHVSVLNQFAGGLSVIENVRNSLIELRDKVDTPLRVEVLEGWGTALNAATESTLKLHITRNLYFGGPTADSTFIPKLTSSPAKATLSLHAADSGLKRKSSEASPSATLAARTNKLEITNLSELEADELARITVADDSEWDFATDGGITVTVTVMGTSTPKLARLRLSCENVASSTALFENFNVWIPIGIGPLVVNYQGRVGIGTTWPGALLEVAGTLKADLTSDTLVGLKIDPTFDDGRWTDVSHYGLLVTKGNVGIGTPTPQSKLSVSGGLAIGSGYVGKKARDKNLIVEGKVGIGTPTPEATLHVEGSDETENGLAAAILLRNIARSNTRTWYLRAGAEGTDTPAGGFSIADDVGYRLAIDNNGKVGINTTTPKAMLDVKGDVILGKESTPITRIVAGEVQVIETFNQHPNWPGYRYSMSTKGKGAVFEFEEQTGSMRVKVKFEPLLAHPPICYLCTKTENAAVTLKNLTASGFTVSFDAGSVEFNFIAFDMKFT